MTLSYDELKRWIHRSVSNRSPRPSEAQLCVYRFLGSCFKPLDDDIRWGVHRGDADRAGHLLLMSELDSLVEAVSSVRSELRQVVAESSPVTKELRLEVDRLREENERLTTRLSNWPYQVQQSMETLLRMMLERDAAHEAAEAVLNAVCGDVLPDQTIRVECGALDALRQKLRAIKPNLS